jgi:hypothetical protein
LKVLSQTTASCDVAVPFFLHFPDYLSQLGLVNRFDILCVLA